MSSASNVDNEKNDLNEQKNNTDDDKIAELKIVHSKEVNQLKVNASREIISRIIKSEFLICFERFERKNWTN